MTRSLLSTVCLLFLVVGARAAGPALAADVGQVKVSKGTVSVERDGSTLAAPVGMGIRSSDVVVTGADGSVGIVFADASLLSAGPGSVLAIERFVFDSTTHEGGFETRLQKGTLTAVSGKLAKRTPEAMKIRTPSSVLAVRGTELAVRVGGPAE
jgi:hypothetical protein